MGHKIGLAQIGLAKIGLAKIGFGQNWPGPNHDGQKWIGQNWIGQNWSNQDGQNGSGQSRLLPLLVRSRRVSWEHKQPSHLPSTTRNHWFPGTICLRPRQRRPQTARDHSHGTTLGVFFPGACAPPPMASVANWMPRNNVTLSAMNSKQRAAFLWEGVMSKSRSMMFVDKSAQWHFPLQILFCQAPQLCFTQRGGGQKRRVAQTVKGRSKRRRRSKRTPFGSRIHLHSMDWQCREWHGSKEGHSAISQEHAGLETTVARAHGLGGVRGRSGLRISAIHDSLDTALLRHHLSGAATLPQVLPMAV